MTIPEDVKTAAYEAMKTVDELGALGVIARAILAERQRCADVAAKWAADDIQAGETRLAARYIRREILAPA